MPKLTEDQKLYAVMRFACFDTPSMVRKGMADQWRIDVPLAQLGMYDASTANGARLSKDLTEVFTKTRKRFLKDTSSIPVANKAVRLRLLNDAVYGAVEKKNIGLMASLLEQAAKESGEAFTNRAHITHAGKVDTNTISDLDLTKELAKYGITARLPKPGGDQGAGNG